MIPFLSFDVDCFYRHWAIDIGQDAGANLETVFECSSAAGIVAAVNAGLGVALLSDRHLHPDMEIIDARLPAPPSLAYIIRRGQEDQESRTGQPDFRNRKGGQPIWEVGIGWLGKRRSTAPTILQEAALVGTAAYACSSRQAERFSVFGREAPLAVRSPTPAPASPETGWVSIATGSVRRYHGKIGVHSRPAATTPGSRPRFHPQHIDRL